MEALAAAPGATAGGVPAAAISYALARKRGARCKNATGVTFSDLKALLVFKGAENSLFVAKAGKVATADLKQV